MPRGTDFAARWSEGAWAEVRILEALNAKDGLRAVQFGITDGTAFWSVREMEARDLPEQSLHGKRPDILVFDKDDLTPEEADRVELLYELPDDDADPLVARALLAIESEFSPYDYGHRLREYGKELSFTLKDEDLQPLRRWNDHFPVPLALVQVYLDSAFYLAFDVLTEGIERGTIKRQRERAYDKDVYYPRMSSGISFARFGDSPTIEADVILDKYGKYTPFRKVVGGRLDLAMEMDEELRRVRRLRSTRRAAP